MARTRSAAKLVRWKNKPARHQQARRHVLAQMLIHGARSVLLQLKRHPDQAEGWLARLANRRNPNIAAVALANKNARTVWALLARGREYQTGYRAADAAAA